MPRKFVYDYYDVFIPRDAVPRAFESNEAFDELFTLAFSNAKQRTRICAMPCEWTAHIIDEPLSAHFHVRVCRKRHRSVRPHFHMLVGMPGYMPDTNYTCRSRHRAEGLALSEARGFRSDWDCDEDRSYYSAVGNMHDGYEVYRRGDDPPREVYMTIRVTECFEGDCLKELEEQGE